MKKIILAVIAIISLGLGFLVSSIVSETKPLDLESALWFGKQAKALPEFSLYDHDNRPLNNDRLSGKWSLIFFGFTHCPDVCPTSLQTLAEMMKAIDDKVMRETIQVIFVSVDPDRDSPAILKSYVGYFDAGFIGATARIPDLEVLTNVLGIAHERDKTSENQQDYSVSHSGAIVLINPAGEYAGLFRAPHNSRTMASDLSKIIARN